MSPNKDNPENAEASRFTASCNKAEEAALRLIARAEQNSLGLIAKLERKEFDTNVIKAVISGLIERGLLNDERYAELWLRSRLAKKIQSPKSLLISLRKRGIDRNSAKKALEKVLDEDAEYALLLQYLEKLEKTPPSKAKKVPSQRAQLKYEGFSALSLDRYFEDF